MSSNRSQASPWLLPGLALVAAALLCAVAVSGQSFWIDEVGTWRLTQAADLGTWARQLLGWRNSDAQMPLYHAYIKLWYSVFGTREWLLRLSNLPWLALAIYPFLRAPVRQAQQGLIRLAGAICLLHPLTWYYANELRPYTMLLAGSTLAGVGLLGVWWESDSAAQRSAARHCLISGLALLAVSSAIGVIWTLAFLPAAVWLAAQRHGPRLGLTKAHAVVIVLWLCVLLPVFVQYAASFLAGVTATTLNENKLVNFGYAFYELLGLAGLGPGREELRVAAVAALRTHGVAPAVGAVLLASVSVIGLRSAARRCGWGAVGVVVSLGLLPVLVLFGLAELKHWRVVGRHMLPALFFVAWLLAEGITSLWAPLPGARTGRIGARLLAVLALGALLMSSLDIRFAARHEREMYREAAAAARVALARPAVVWWFGDGFGAEFYGLGEQLQKLVPPVDYDNGAPLIFTGLKGRVVKDCSQVRAGTLLVLENTSAEALASCPKPGLVILSRRDAFDRTGTGQAYLAEHGFKLRASLVGFEVWE